MINILIYFLSLIPPVGIFIWLMKRPIGTENYVHGCKEALKWGLLCIFPVALGSGATDLIGRLLHISRMHDVIWQLYFNFIVLAFVEEAAKFMLFRKTLKKYEHSWFTAMSLMVITAIGFEVLESIVYAVGASPMVMIVRGATSMHVAFGAITGYFYGKALYTGKKGYAALGFCISWLLHGFYDFCLKPSVMEVSEGFGYAALGIAVGCIGVIIWMIMVFIKGKDKEKYNKVLESFI